MTEEGVMDDKISFQLASNKHSNISESETSGE